MNIYLNSGYCDIESIIKAGLTFNFIVGGRGTGKTYGALKFEYIGCDNEKECQKIYQNLGNVFNFDIDIDDFQIPDDENYKDDSYTNETLINNPETIYVIYYTGSKTKLMLFRILLKTENDGNNEQIIKYTTFGKWSGNAEELNNCRSEVALLTNEQLKQQNRLSKEEQMKTFNEIIYKYYPDANIKYVECNTEEETKNCWDKITYNLNLPKTIENKVVKTFNNKSGKGLYNAGLYDNIKEFVNFRKDTGETLHYLLQRIIALENDMKTVKNKMVSNDIRTNLRNKNIDLNNEDDEDFDDNDNRGNGFMCSRCGMINPKFFKNDYPTLSEFREQFSKL